MLKASKRRFIVIEGHEGTGKSTIALALKARLTAMGRDVVHQREPGGTQMAEEVREVLLKKRTEIVDPFTDIMLHMAYRRQNVVNTIVPALESEKWVIAERFVGSTWALNVAPFLDANPRVADLFMGLMPFTLGETLPEPMQFILELPDAEREARMVNQGRELDRYESDADRMRHTGAAYEDLKESPGAVVIDASKTVDEIVDQIIGIVDTTLVRYDDTIAESQAMQDEAETQVDGIDAEQVAESAEPGEFNLDDAVSAYVEETVIPALFEGNEEPVAEYKVLADKLVRLVYAQMNDDASIFTTGRQELTQRVHSMFHYSWKLDQVKLAVANYAPITE